MQRRWSTPIAFLFALIPALAQSGVHAQESPRSRFADARLAWDTGHFIQSLEIMEDLLSAPGGSDLTREIALLTGEIHPVTEITTDGRAVRWSPDGRFAAYEVGAGSEVTTRLLELAGGELRSIGTVEGSGLVFSHLGDRVAYLIVPETEELLAARARIREEFGGTDRTSRRRLQVEMSRLNTLHSRVVVRDLDQENEEVLETAGSGILSLLYGPEGNLHFVGSEEGRNTTLFRFSHGGGLVPVAESTGQIGSPFFAGRGAFLVYGTGGSSFNVVDLAGGDQRDFQGAFPVASADGSTLAFIDQTSEENSVKLLSLTEGTDDPVSSIDTPFRLSTSSSQACTGCPRQSGLALSPNGGKVVFQGMPREDWELFLGSTGIGSEESDLVQLTREVQHDLYPTFLADGRLMAMKGEGRHRRSHLYDLESGEATWLFRNNTIRTVAPEYEWALNPSGTKLLLVAERDGNTVSPQRGVYFMDLTREVTQDDVLSRIRKNLIAERELLAHSESMYSPLSREIESVLAGVSMSRMFDDEHALFQFGSKHITQPGNRLATDYLVEELRKAGFEPELQWFNGRGVETANVIAKLPGTTSPDVVYTVSAHFDSNSRSPGADDNTSATVGLLEMARVMADHPMPATIEIALFTGEEAGLLGSREYVRRALESGKKLVGALNNDMVGFAEDHRLDNTIRYSNMGIRDLQHGAAILFTEMILHDAEYYKSTDAAAYYDGYGDIVGGIGSYPILANPHYHQSHDVLETVNHKLVTEVAKTTIASMMLMASSPSRVAGLEAADAGSGRVALTWNPAVEEDATEYLVAWGPEDDLLLNSIQVEVAHTVVEGSEPGWVYSVKAVNARGLKGWDWARVRVDR